LLYQQFRNEIVRTKGHALELSAKLGGPGKVAVLPWWQATNDYQYL
jgi:hypothetical protein